MIMGSRTLDRPADTSALAAEIAELAASKLRSEHPDAPMPRDAHPKSHGLVRAELIIAWSLPKGLQVGPFIPSTTYDAWVRFSNGSPSSSPDSRPDVRGMAIKIMGVEGAKILEDERDATTIDFVVCNHPAFFVKTPADYLVFFKGISAGFKALFTQFFFPSLNPFSWRLRELWNFGRGVLKNVPSPSEIQYWSQTPYWFGAKVVKYSLKPCVVPPYVKPAKDDPNRLRNALVSQLRNGDVVFDFMVQVRSDDGTMPIEDARIRWSERKSPFVKVGWVRIPSQVFDTEARRAFDENLSFTPWHTLPEMAPMGAINAVRRIVYQTISKLRHSVNGVVRKEPVA